MKKPSLLCIVGEPKFHGRANGGKTVRIVALTPTKLADHISIRLCTVFTNAVVAVCVYLLLFVQIHQAVLPTQDLQHFGSAYLVVSNDENVFVRCNMHSSTEWTVHEPEQVCVLKPCLRTNRTKSNLLSQWFESEEIWLGRPTSLFFDFKVKDNAQTPDAFSCSFVSSQSHQTYTVNVQL